MNNRKRIYSDSDTTVMDLGNGSIEIEQNEETVVLDLGTQEEVIKALGYTPKKDYDELLEYIESTEKAMAGLLVALEHMAEKLPALDRWTLNRAILAARSEEYADEDLLLVTEALESYTRDMAAAS